jgi:hypothetical protein
LANRLRAQRKPAEALVQFEAAAKAGCLEALGWISRLYLGNLGVPKDYNRAFEVKFVPIFSFTISSDYSELMNSMYSNNVMA